MDEDSDDCEAPALGGEETSDRVVLGGTGVGGSDGSLGVGLVLLKGRVLVGASSGGRTTSQNQLHNIGKLVLNVGVGATELLEGNASLLEAVLGDEVTGRLDKGGEQEHLDQGGDTVDGEEDAPLGGSAKAKTDQVGDQDTDDNEELVHGSHGTTALDRRNLSEVGGSNDTSKTAGKTDNDTTDNELGLVVGQSEKNGTDNEEDVTDEHGLLATKDVLDSSSRETTGQGTKTEGANSETLLRQLRKKSTHG